MQMGYSRIYRYISISQQHQHILQIRTEVSGSRRPRVTRRSGFAAEGPRTGPHSMYTRPKGSSEPPCPPSRVLISAMMLVTTCDAFSLVGGGVRGGLLVMLCGGVTCNSGCMLMAVGCSSRTVVAIMGGRGV